MGTRTSSYAQKEPTAHKLVIMQGVDPHVRCMGRAVSWRVLAGSIIQLVGGRGLYSHCSAKLGAVCTFPPADLYRDMGKRRLQREPRGCESLWPVSHVTITAQRQLAILVHPLSHPPSHFPGQWAVHSPRHIDRLRRKFMRDT